MPALRSDCAFAGVFLLAFLFFCAAHRAPPSRKIKHVVDDWIQRADGLQIKSHGDIHQIPMAPPFLDPHGHRTWSQDSQSPRWLDAGSMTLPRPSGRLQMEHRRQTTAQFRLVHDGVVGVSKAACAIRSGPSSTDARRLADEATADRCSVPNPRAVPGLVAICSVVVRAGRPLSQRSTLT